MLETTDNNAFAPQLAIDESGDAIAVWAQDNGTGYNAIYANHYSVDSNTWNGAGEIGSYPSDGYTAQIAMDGEGNAIALWYQVGSVSGYSIWSSRFNSGLWDDAVEIESGVNVAAIPQIAFDAHGSGIALWKNSDGRLHYNTYMPNTGWGTVDNVESGNDSIFVPQLAVDSEGNAIAVWRQVTNLYYNSMWASRYQFGNGWSTPELLEMNDTYAVSFPEVAIDSNGAAFAIWIQSDGSADSTWVSRFE